MKNKPKSINKRTISRSVARRLQHQIHHEHVENIISLFIDEFSEELKIKEKINIPNFCAFYVEKTKPRKYHNLVKQRFAISSGKKILKIKLSKTLRNQIVKHLDLIKTFI